MFDMFVLFKVGLTVVLYNEEVIWGALVEKRLDLVLELFYFCLTTLVVRA